MTRESSVAPKERVNIVYRSITENSEKTVELPFKQLVIGNFSGNDGKNFEERETVPVNKENFDDVLAAHNVALNFNVKNVLKKDDDSEINVSLKFSSIKDFNPEIIAGQIPELSKLIALREALTALKGPLNNTPDFRKKIREFIDNPAQRQKLLLELGLELHHEKERSHASD